MLATRTTLSIALVLTTLAIAGLPAHSAESDAGAEVVLRSDLKFQPLNPARGDASPQAGVLWGDIKEDVPSGVLLKFAPGFSSPPHIHNITYRAVVIDGAVHNDDPDAKAMWMGPGSFWTQPAGESHITSGGKGSGATAFLEILEGPYLVQPSDEAFNNGEQPVNIDAGNVVWLDASDVTWVDQHGTAASGSAVQMAFLWGNPHDGQGNGTFLKLPSGFEGELSGNGPWLRSVVVNVQVDHRLTDADEVSKLEPGSYFGSRGGTVHRISCQAVDGCQLYVRTEGKYQVVASAS